MRDFLCSVFPNFNGEMYDGNIPCGKGHTMVDGGRSDRWSTQYGGGETYNGKILHASFSLNHKVSIFICGNTLHILDIRYSGKFDFWEYTNNSNMKQVTTNERYRHRLESEKIEQILNTKIKNCKFWDLVQERAKELYAQGIINEIKE